jgi:actin-like ATPase involved in cell morphogenesis
MVPVRTDTAHRYTSGASPESRSWDSAPMKIGIVLGTANILVYVKG